MPAFGVSSEWPLPPRAERRRHCFRARDACCVPTLLVLWGFQPQTRVRPVYRSSAVPCRPECQKARVRFCSCLLLQGERKNKRKRRRKSAPQAPCTRVVCLLLSGGQWTPPPSPSIFVPAACTAFRVTPTTSGRRFSGAGCGWRRPRPSPRGKNGRSADMFHRLNMAWRCSPQLSLC